MILCFKIPHSCHVRPSHPGCSAPHHSFYKTWSSLTGVETEENSALIWLSHACAPMSIGFWNKKAKKKLFFSSVMFFPWENDHGKYCTAALTVASRRRKRWEKSKLQGGRKKQQQCQTSKNSFLSCLLCHWLYSCMHVKCYKPFSINRSLRRIYRTGSMFRNVTQA